MRIAIALLLLCLSVPDAQAGPLSRLRLDVQWWNDLFADPPPADDQGFTNDFLLRAAWDRAQTKLAVELWHRMLTERYGSRRWDQLELTVAATRIRKHRSLELEGSLLAGPSLGGNFGGCAIQNTWHRVTGTGATVGNGLQATYDGGRRVALMTGARATAAWVFAYGQVHSGLEARLALGSTGVSRVSGIAGTLLGTSRFRLGLDLAISRYQTRDPNLELRGGYGTGAWQLEPRLMLAVHVDRYAFGWQLRANESGSDEPVGVLWFAAHG